MIGIEAEIAGAIKSFRIDEGRLRAYLTGPQGPVYRDLSRRAIRVENAAKRHATGRPGPRVRTGRLRGSITWRLGKDTGLTSGTTFPYADIGTNVHYAPFVELGHNVVRNGRTVGRAPAYPFLRPALAAAAGPAR